MSDTSDTGTTVEDADSGENDAQWIKDLREKAKKLDAITAENADLKRQRAFDQAGIPDDGMGEMFRDAYKGELDVDAIVADATTRGLIEPAAEGLEPEVLAEDTAALGRIADANTGAAPPAPTGAIERAAEAAARGDQAGVDAELAALNLSETDLRMAFGDIV